jgi:hypothetical protein
MSSPISHGLLVGGLIPIARELYDYKKLNLGFYDYYTEIFSKLGITRDELMILMPMLMSVDVLTGTQKLKRYRPK